MELDIQELKIPYGSKGTLTGKLKTANPLSTKPDNMSAQQWAVAIITAATKSKYQVLAIPISLWPSDTTPAARNAALGDLSHVEILDRVEDVSTLHGITPARGLQAIFDALKAGKDVLVLGVSPKINGFVPAMLCKMLPSAPHVEKIAYPIIKGERYELTQFQLGCLYG